MDYNGPRKTAPQISILLDGNYNIPLMLYLREKELIHNYVETSAGDHQGESFDRIRKHSQETSASFRLGNANDFRLHPYNASQLVIPDFLLNSWGKSPA